MSGLGEKGRYCTCNSKTNPCIVCGKPKFIDPEWLKRKIEEEPDGMEVGAGFEIFSAPASASATPADVGEEPVAYMDKTGKVSCASDRIVDLLEALPDAPFGQSLLPLYSATALERVVRDRDEAVNAALRARLETVEAGTRERIAAALDEEANLIRCAEDAMVTRSNARLVRANFSYEDAERLEAEEDAAAIRNLEPRHD